MAANQYYHQNSPDAGGGWVHPNLNILQYIQQILKG